MIAERKAIDEGEGVLKGVRHGLLYLLGPVSYDNMMLNFGTRRDGPVGLAEMSEGKGGRLIDFPLERVSFPMIQEARPENDAYVIKLRFSRFTYFARRHVVLRLF